MFLPNQIFVFPRFLFLLVFISFKIHKKIYFRPACVALFNLINFTPPALSLSLIPLHLLPFKADLNFPDFCLFPELFLAKIGMLILDFLFPPLWLLNSLCSPFCLCLYKSPQLLQFLKSLNYFEVSGVFFMESFLQEMRFLPPKKQTLGFYCFQIRTFFLFGGTIHEKITKNTLSQS